MTITAFHWQIDNSNNHLFIHCCCWKQFNSKWSASPLVIFFFNLCVCVCRWPSWRGGETAARRVTSAVNANTAEARTAPDPEGLGQEDWGHYQSHVASYRTVGRGQAGDKHLLPIPPPPPRTPRTEDVRSGTGSEARIIETNVKDKHIRSPWAGRGSSERHSVKDTRGENKRQYKTRWNWGKLEKLCTLPACLLAIWPCLPSCAWLICPAFFF